MQIRIGFSIIILTILLPQLVQGQSMVSGMVKDADDAPLEFVTVAEQGTSNGTITKSDGSFHLQLKNDANAVLVFSFLGYTTVSVAYQGEPSLEIVLTEEAQLLDEVIVIGYGTQKKSDITGSVAIIDVADATTVPTTSVAEMLRGKSAGVQVTLQDARPGGGSSILIRGRNSLLGGNDPLFIVDGVPASEINSINADDVKSIEILKDASAQAIYGARASNGVILVTTKRGSSGKFSASFHSYYGQQWLTKNFDLYSGEEWAQLRREAYRTDNNGEYEPDDFVFTPIQLDVIESGEYVDWEDEVMQNASQQNHTLSITGGTESTNIYSSFGYFDQNGLIPGSAYKRGTARFNIDQKISDRFSLGANIYLLTDQQDIESSSLKFITLPPVAKVRDENGDLIRYPTGDPSTTSPLWNMRESVNESKANDYQLTLFGEIEIFKNFKYRMNSFVSRRSGNRGSYLTSLHSSGFSVDGKASIFSESREEYLIENIFTYDNHFNEKNRFDITVMQSLNERSYSNTTTSATGFPNDLLGYNGIESAAEVLPVGRAAWDRSLVSFMGRVRYYLSDKYLLTLTGRADGSSVFAPDNKWGFFPSAALAWKTHLEPFMSDLDFVNELKLRVSYGSIGNEAIAPYQTLGLASAENYIFGGVTQGGYQAGSSLFNPDLRWETSTSANLGVDFGLFGNVIVGNFELYNTITSDLLIDRTTPGGTGYTNIISNIGEVKNSGIELGITGNLISKQNLDWSVGVTYSRNHNEILELFGEVDDEGNPLDDITRNRFIGEPINVIFQYEYDGIWQMDDDIAGSSMPDAEPGHIRVTDINGDSIINTDDRVIIHADPDWYGSFSTRLRLHGFELFADIYVVKGAMKTNNYLADYNSGGTLQGVLNGIKVDYWLPENPTGYFPRPVRSAQDRFLWSAAVSDASYVRLRTLSLSYHFPQQWLKKIKVANLTMYMTATNLLTITEYKSYSPEVNVNSFPDAKSYIFGIKITI